MTSSIYTLWWASLLLKFILAAWLPLASDEAYYWVWSHHPQLSYYDHPPLVSWLFWLGQPLEGFLNSVRWPGVLLGHLTLLIWLHLLRPLLNHQQLWWFLILALLSPLTGPGSVIITPDIGLLFFWSLSLLLFVKAMARPSPLNYGACGMALGLGLVAKYHIFLFAPLALIWIAWSQRWKDISLRLLPVVFVGFFLTSFPVWWWNWQNDWVSFRFQIDHGLGAQQWKFSWTWMYVVGQLLLIFPTVFYFAVRSRPPRQIAWLGIMAWGPLVFFLLTSFKGRVEANWPIVAYPAVLALAVFGATQFRWARVTAAVWMGALLILISQLAFSWLPEKAWSLKTQQFHKFENLSQLAENHQPLFARSFQMAAKISYETKIQVYKLHGFNRRDFYDFRQESIPKTARYYVATKIDEPLPEWTAKANHVILNRIRVDDSYEIVEVATQ